jgi:putative nucleotidyltransferase with HDIG domain
LRSYTELLENQLLHLFVVFSLFPETCRKNCSGRKNFLIPLKFVVLDDDKIDSDTRTGPPGKSMQEHEVKRYIKQLNDLSTTPALLGKILTLFRDDNASTEDLCTLISYDPAMAERVLRVANSAFFAHSGQIKDIHQAVLFLGLERIKAIAVGMTVINVFPSPGSFHVENLWLHSYEVAFLSSALSDHIAVTQPQECFLSGLLHDIGRLVLYNIDHRRFHQIETTDTMLEQETTLFGCTHAEAGAWFAEEIGLPSAIVTTVRHHHKPSAAPEEMHMVSLVSLAEALTRTFSPRVEDDGIWTPEHDAILLEFSLSEHDLQKIGDQFRNVKSEIEKFFTPESSENSGAAHTTNKKSDRQ